MKKTFLSAEWRKLILMNYAVDSPLLEKYLPANTELDFWNGTCYVSLVGFLFVNTKIKGIRVPFHTDFEEVNLRFYVRYPEQGTFKRGVVFIKEIVPKPAISLVANLLYGEHYETRPMRHFWQTTKNTLTVEYRWQNQRWHTMQVSATPTPHPIAINSEEEFITEHFWGYTKVTANKTAAYEVAHPRWKLYPVQDFILDVDFKAVYGPDFAFLNQAQPRSVFLAEGSEIWVKEGGLLKA